MKLIKKLIKKTVKALLILLGLLFVAGAAGCGYLYYRYHPAYEEYKAEAARMVAESDPELFMKNLSSYIYDADGNLISKLSIDSDSDYLPYEEIPESVIHAFIAVEDRNFWEHEGYDLNGILRVCYRFVVTKGEERHGASTITQQLARSTFLSSEVTLERKVREILLAVELEKKYTKEQILEYYVNGAYFANRCYGIEAAAKKYFSKSAGELSLGEAAYLCAIPNAPSYYDPLKNEDHALARREKILGDMYDCGYITFLELSRAQRQPIQLDPKPAGRIQNYETTYAVDCAIRYLMKLEGFVFRYEFEDMDAYRAYQDHYDNVYEECRGKLYTGGYVIRTSLDPEKQELLQSTIDEMMAFDGEVSEEGIYALQCASTVIDNRTHQVVAIVGGRSQETGIYTLNRAYQSWRQPGSTFKPLAVYTPALEEGYTAESMLPNIDVTKAKEMGLEAVTLSGSRMSMEKAVWKSVNGCAWWLFCSLTPQRGLSCISRMEFAGIVPDDYYPAAALGGLTYGVTTAEMAGAYSALACHGEFCPVTCLLSIQDREKKELYRAAEPKTVYDPQAAEAMVEILKGVLQYGTAASVGWDLEVEAAGKTGTTNECKDGWFCGITPDYSMSVWVGYDEPKVLQNLYGSTYPASIWKAVMTRLAEDSTRTAFAKSEPEENFIYSPVGALDRDSYMPGRREEEVLSEGYTVKDYRDDHILADNADAIMYEMSLLDTGNAYYAGEWQKLYEDAEDLIGQIYSRKLRSKETEKLQALKAEQETD